MFCGKCGKEIKKDNLYCILCGEKAEDASIDETKYITLKQKNIKEHIDAALSLGEVIETVITETGRDISGHSGTDIIKLDLLKFCFYICNLNYMNINEKGDIITKYLDYDVDGALFLPVIKEADIIDDLFSTEIPFSITVMAKVDQLVDTKGCKIIIDAFNELGLALLYCDIGCDDRAGAVKGYENYITMLNKYVEAECGYIKAEETKLLSYQFTYELGRHERRENDIVLCITRYNDKGELGITILIVVYDKDDKDYEYFLRDYDLDGNVIHEKKGEFSGLKLIKPTDGTYCVVEFSGTEIVISSEQYKELSRFLYSNKSH